LNSILFKLDKTRSQEFTIYAKLDDNNLSAGRKRQTQNITDNVLAVIGGSFASSSLTQVKTTVSLKYSFQETHYT